jgi:NitT/TauT family transport system substrate-binding protein
VRLDFLPSSNHLAFHLATEKGWFTGRGLDVQIEDGSGSGITVQAVGGGRVDIGLASLAVMATARDKGLPLKAVAGILRRGDLGIVVPEGSGLKSPKDFEGKRVIYTPGSVEAPFLAPFFKGSLDKVNLIGVDAAAKAPTYLSGRGDALITLVPSYIPLFKTQRPSEYILFSDFGLAMPSLGLFVTEETLRTKRDGVCTFVDVVAQSWQYILDGHEGEGVDAMLKQRPQAGLPSRATLLAMLEEYRSFFHTPNTKGGPLGWQSEEDWAQALKVMGDAGVVRKGLRPADFYTNECIRAR